MTRVVYLIVMSLGMKRFSAQKLSLGLLWKELEVYSKLVFRGRNQHRRDKTYQMLVRVSIYAQLVSRISHVVFGGPPNVKD